MTHGFAHGCAWSAAAVLLAALVGCGPNYSPDTYSSNAVQQANKVEQGVVVGVRAVDISAPGTVGAVTGAAAGGIAGSQAASGVGAALGALGGGVVGGLLGTGIEHEVADTNGFEYIVRKANGEMVSVTQKDPAPLAIGTHVLVIAGNQARIVADYTVPVETDKQPTAAKADPASVAKPAVAPAAAPPPSAPPPDAAASASATQTPTETATKSEPAVLSPPVQISPLTPPPAPEAAPAPETVPSVPPEDKPGAELPLPSDDKSPAEAPSTDKPAAATSAPTNTPPASTPQ